MNISHCLEYMIWVKQVYLEGVGIVGDIVNSNSGPGNTCNMKEYTAMLKGRET